MRASRVRSSLQGDSRLGICRSSVGIATEMGFSTVCWWRGSGPDSVWTTFRANITDYLLPETTATTYSIVQAVTLIHGPSDSAGGSLAAAPATTPATGASAGGPGPTETPSAGTRNVLENGVALLLGGFIAALVGSGMAV